MPITYVTIQQFCTFHQCDTVIIEEFLEHGIVKVHLQNDLVVIPEPEVPRLERAYRLHADLGVNAAGIDIILNLLDRLEGERFMAIEDID
ncbi:chaperone modulator CbpM [Neolewinella persica]|uniref:chaperone modulator CbpM n=1 Tax=Neolewinella persica TaxID=70998 RepID=UPI00036B37F6|nr:chaperone modulator CbpM [Neolewinella persica]